MANELSYTEGIIAVKEKYLLKEKLLRLCEMTAEDAFRTLLEGSYGGGAETTNNVYEYEKLVAKEEADTDAFIREFAPSNAELAYLLSPNDFHNAKALFKAAYLGVDVQKMLAADGVVSIETMAECIKSGDFTALSGQPALMAACEAAAKYVSGEETVAGAKLGMIFEKGLYAHLSKACRKNGALKRMVATKADMVNILTAFRVKNEAEAQEYFVGGGKLTAADLATLLQKGEEVLSMDAFAPYVDFLRVCFAAKEKGLSLSAAEKIADAHDVDGLKGDRYELKARQEFLYYVLTRRAENANVRMIFALKLLGVAEADIKKRLRGV